MHLSFPPSLANYSIVALLLFAVAQNLNIIDTNLAPLFSYAGRTVLFLTLLVLAVSVTPEYLPLILIVPTLLQLEYLRDALNHAHERVAWDLKKRAGVA